MYLHYLKVRFGVPALCGGKALQAFPCDLAGMAACLTPDVCFIRKRRISPVTDTILTIMHHNRKCEWFIRLNNVLCGHFIKHPRIRSTTETPWHKDAKKLTNCALQTGQQHRHRHTSSISPANVRVDNIIEMAGCSKMKHKSCDRESISISTVSMMDTKTNKCLVNSHLNVCVVLLNIY